jgi:hypothetical protein
MDTNPYIYPNTHHIRWAAFADGFYRAALFVGNRRISVIGRISFEADAAIAEISGRRGLEFLFQALAYRESDWKD